MFPPGFHDKRINFAKITPAEADAIEAALRSSPDDVAGIAARFTRSEWTIRKIGERRGILRRKCSSSTSTSANQKRQQVQEFNQFPVENATFSFGDLSEFGA